MKPTFVKKGVIVGVAVLLCSLTLSPVFAHTRDRTYPTAVQQPRIDIAVEEHTADGTVVTHFVPLTQKEINALKKDLLQADSGDARLTILQDYGLIPADVTPDDLERGMRKRAEALGFSPERIENILLKLDPIVKQRPPILLDFFSEVNTIFLGGCTFRIGLSALIGYLNFLRGWNLPKVDMLDIAWGMFGVVDSSGLLNRHSMVTFPGYLCLAGFVGYNVKLPLLLNTYYGYSAMTFAAGLGFHTVIWFYWLSNLEPPPE
jgi:hypothetical protein